MTDYDKNEALDHIETHKRMIESQKYMQAIVFKMIHEIAKSHDLTKTVLIGVEVYLNKSGQLLLNKCQHEVEFYFRGEKRRSYPITTIKIQNHEPLNDITTLLPSELLDRFLYGLFSNPYNVQCLMYRDNNRILLEFEIEMDAPLTLDPYLKITRLDPH